MAEKKEKKENEHNADIRVWPPKIAGRIRAVRWMSEWGRGEGVIDPGDLNNSAGVSHLQEMAARFQSEMRFEGASYVARMPRSGKTSFDFRPVASRLGKVYPFRKSSNAQTHTHRCTDACIYAWWRSVLFGYLSQSTSIYATDHRRECACIPTDCTCN